MKLEVIETQDHTPLTSISYGVHVLTVDDHTLVRAGLALLVNEIDAKAKVMHASSAAEALALAEESPCFDLILLDIDIPDMNGLCLLPKVWALSPNASIIVITGNQDASIEERAIALGAKAYLTKNTDGSTIKKTLAHFIRKHQKQSIPEECLRFEQQVLDSQTLASRFTSRQLQVLECLAQGMSNKEISRTMYLSEGVIKSHVTVILDLLGVNNRTQAVVAAAQRGLL